MKKKLLIVTSLLFSVTAFSQFTQSNTPVAGDGITLYVIDSLAPNMDSETGSAANWDYSSYSGYDNETRAITAFDASTTTNASEFPNADVSIDLENYLQTYSSSTATELTGRGFVFNEPSIGEVIAKFNTDQANLLNYPMDENSPVINDLFSGDLIYTLPFVGVQTTPLQGKLQAQVDGKGTLTLAQNAYNNVLRYKTLDTLSATITGFGDVQIIRSQYEYYDHAQNNLPIFVHISVEVGILGGAALSSSTLVMSLEDPTTFVGLPENELAKTSVYPVPATDVLNIELPSTIEVATVVMTDVQGREIYSSTLNSSTKSIDVSNMKKGMYIVKISSEDTSVTKNVLIK